MPRPGGSWPGFASAVIVAAFLATGCSKPERIQVGQVMRMGQFVLRADRVEAERSFTASMPLEVRVHFTIGGGNRFDRVEFTETVSSRGRVVMSSATGWRIPCWLSGTDDDMRHASVVTHPPLGSSGYSLEIGNPYGEPRRFILDLGKAP